MEHLVKLLRDSYDLQEERSEETAYWHLQKLRSEIKQLTLTSVGSSLPKVCKGCGSLSTKVIDKKYLACCPDSNYIPMEEYCKNSIYPEKQF